MPTPQATVTLNQPGSIDAGTDEDGERVEGITMEQT